MDTVVDTEIDAMAEPRPRSRTTRRAAGRWFAVVGSLLMLAAMAPVVSDVAWPTASAGAAATGCPDNETCLLVVQVRDPTDPSCDYGCPSGDAIEVTATGLRTDIPGDYVPPTDFIVIYEVPTSGSNCVGVVGTEQGCIEVQSCPVDQSTCAITLSWNWNASYPGSTTTHVFEAWTINTAGNYPDYCSGKTWFQYSTSYIYPYLGSSQLGLSEQSPAGAAGAGIAETATAVPEGTAVTVRTYAIDPPFYDSNFSTYQCSSDLEAPPGVGACTTLADSFTYPDDQPFASSSTSGYAGCNAASIPTPPGWTWPSPLTDNGPFESPSPTTRFYISTQAVYIADPASNDVPCIGLSASQPQIGVSNWLAVSWYCPPAVAGLTAASGSGQSAVDGTPFAQPLAALVENSCTGQGLPGSAVTFSVPPGAGTFAGGGTTETDVTGSDGVATSTALTAGDTPQSFVAEATDQSHSAPFSLTDTCNLSWGSGLSVVSGTPQSAPAGSPFGQPLVSKVVNQCGGALAGATVRFAAPTGRASFDGPNPQEVDVSSAADGTASSGTVTADASASGLGTYAATATATYPGPFSPSPPVDYQLTNECNPAIPGSLAIAAGDGQSTGEGEAFAPLTVDVLDQCGTPWSDGQVTFTGPTADGQPAVSFGVPSGVTTATVPVTTGGQATSPIPFADDVAGPLSVGAGVSSAGVAPVDFALTIVPAAGSAPPILPTAARGSGRQRPRAAVVLDRQSSQRRKVTAEARATRSGDRPFDRWRGDARSRSKRRAHNSHPVVRGETTSSQRPGGTA